MLAYHEPSRWSDVAAEMTLGGAILVLTSCINGLAISYAGLRVQQMVTATSFMVLTNVNKFVVILFGVLVLKDELTALSTLGVLLAMGGGLWYGRARSRMQEFSAAPPAAPTDKAEKEGEPLLRAGEVPGDEEAAPPPNVRQGGTSRRA